MKIKAIIVIIIISFVSCKEKTSSTEKDKLPPLKVEDKKEEKELLDAYALKVEFSFETDQAGIFQIKYNAQDPNNTLLKNLTVKENRLNIPLSFNSTFDLDMFGAPKSVYLILGVKKLRKVKLRSIKLLTDEVVVNVDKDNLLDYFILNQYTSFDKETGIIETHKHNDKHVPLLTLNKRAFEILNLY